MSAKKTHPQFVKDARALHGDRYSYLSPYRGAVKPVKILCNLCGHTFKQIPNSHLSGRGCPECGKANLLAAVIKERDRCAKVFIERAKQIHGERYDYASTKYGKNCDDRVVVGCRQHGEFKVSPSNHLKGKGCPSCAKSGFDPLKPAYIYLLIGETPDQGEVVKVGISNVPKQRLAQNRRFDGVAWRMARVRRYPDGDLPVAFEKILIDFFGAPFKGKERFAFNHTAALEAFDIVTKL